MEVEWETGIRIRLKIGLFLGGGGGRGRKIIFGGKNSIFNLLNLCEEKIQTKDQIQLLESKLSIY